MKNKRKISSKKIAVKTRSQKMDDEKFTNLLREVVAPYDKVMRKLAE